MYIYISKTPSDVEKNAADELSLYLGRTYGTEFPVLTEESDAAGIFVGFTEFAASHGIAAEGGCNALNGAEAWVIRGCESSLVLTGGRKNTDRGILYAVEHFLEDVIGVRFWNVLEEFVPSLDNFTIDPNLSFSGEPAFEMRYPINGYLADNERFCVRRRINNNNIPDSWGGCNMVRQTVLCST